MAVGTYLEVSCLCLCLRLSKDQDNLPIGEGSELVALVELSEALATPQRGRNMKLIQSGLTRNHCRSGFEHTRCVNP